MKRSSVPWSLKIRALKKWDRNLENRADPLLRQVDSLHNFMTAEMPRAVAYLTEVIKTLEAYADVTMPGSTMNPAPAVPATEPDPNGGATS